MLTLAATRKSKFDTYGVTLGLSRVYASTPRIGSGWAAGYLAASHVRPYTGAHDMRSSCVCSTDSRTLPAASASATDALADRGAPRCAHATIRSATKPRGSVALLRDSRIGGIAVPSALPEQELGGKPDPEALPRWEGPLQTRSDIDRRHSRPTMRATEPQLRPRSTPAPRNVS